MGLNERPQACESACPEYADRADRAVHLTSNILPITLLQAAEYDDTAMVGAEFGQDIGQQHAQFPPLRLFARRCSIDGEQLA